MTREETLLNFFNLKNPTKRQIVEVMKILIKERLKITDDLYFINSLTGERTKKIPIKPIEIDTITDEDIMKNIAKAEAQKILTSDELTKIIDNKIKRR